MERVWRRKVHIEGSMKAQIEAIKQGPAEWFKYNKEEFSREIKQFMKIA